MVVEKGAMEAGFEQPAVEGVQGAGDPKQAVAPVAERLQSRARITKPKATATAIFRKKTSIILGNIPVQNGFKV